MSTAVPSRPFPGERHPGERDKNGGTSTSGDAEVKARVAASFKAFDSGDKGWLNKHDLKCAFISLVGRKPTPAELARMRDACPRGEVELRHFRAFLEPGLSADARDLGPAAARDRARAAFDAFDRNRRGYVTLRDVVHGFARVAPGVPEGVVADVFREADADGDGRVVFGDYARVVGLGSTMDERVSHHRAAASA